MERVIVIGCPGSGKSTFSRALHHVTGIPLHHLDMMYWNADKTTVDEVVFKKKLLDTMKAREWIIDGNYSSTMELRLQGCDTVFFLDYPLSICMEGIRARKGKARTDMPWVETEVEDEEFLSLVHNYSVHNRPIVMELMKKYGDKNWVVFQNRSEAERYLTRLHEKNQP